MTCFFDFFPVGCPSGDITHLKSFSELGQYRFSLCSSFGSESQFGGRFICIIDWSQYKFDGSA
jgi:hypothetical protein